MASTASDIGVVDQHEFMLKVSSAQREDRQRCLLKEQKRAAKWVKFANAGKLPPKDKLKSYCRKVRTLGKSQTSGAQGGAFRVDEPSL